MSKPNKTSKKKSSFKGHRTISNKSKSYRGHSDTTEDMMEILGSESMSEQHHNSFKPRNGSDYMAGQQNQMNNLPSTDPLMIETLAPVNHSQMPGMGFGNGNSVLANLSKLSGSASIDNTQQMPAMQQMGAMQQMPAMQMGGSRINSLRNLAKLY